MSVALDDQNHVVDIHSHIIPGADDGAQTEKEALELVDLDRQEGVDVIFATPHYGIENGYAPDRNMVQDGYDRLQEQMKQREPETRASLYLGTEWYCSERIVQRIRDDLHLQINFFTLFIV